MWRPACATRVAGIVHWMPTRRAGGTAGSRRHSDSWFAQEGLVTTERADAADGATIPGGTREHDLVGDVPIFERSVAMRSIGATIGSIADTDATVLLRGESGVGKDLVARASLEFREDLYYRLNVVELRIPPLRERREEIPALVAWFLDRFNAQYGRQKRLSSETLALLGEHPWWGNVRELENTVRRMVVLPDGEQEFAALVVDGRRRCGTPAPLTPISEGLREIARRAAREAERIALADVLERVRGNRLEASRS